MPYYPPLTSAAIIAALGYTPVNRAGDTMTGQLVNASVAVWLESPPYNAYGYSGGNRIYGQQAAAGAAITGASRLSDAGSVSAAAVGIMGWGFNDGGTTGAGAWGGYFEAPKLSGAQTLPTHGVEINITDYSGQSVVQLTPNSPFNVGATMGLWVASGGGSLPAAQTTSLGIGIVHNSQTFMTGLLIAGGAIEEVGGVRSAIALSASESHQINWWASDAIVHAIYSDGTNLNFEGNAAFDGDIAFGAQLTSGVGVSTGVVSFELGGSRTGNGVALIDFHTQSGTDYELRIVRDSGANGDALIQNVGTGDIEFYTDDTLRLTIGTSAITSVLTLAVGGVQLSTDANGAIALGGVNVTPYIDFNSYNGTPNDYDVRFFVSGGTASTDGAGNLGIYAGGVSLTGYISVAIYIEGTEMSAPSAPAANGFRIFAQDNGAGKTQLMVIFASGAAQQLAIEP